MTIQKISKEFVSANTATISAVKKVLASYYKDKDDVEVGKGLLATLVQNFDVELQYAILVVEQELAKEEVAGNQREHLLYMLAIYTVLKTLTPPNLNNQ